MAAAAQGRVNEQAWFDRLLADVTARSAGDDVASLER
jgi:hypothetical protein